MLKIDLTNAEAAFLKQLLEDNLAARRNELAHTDHRQYRTYVEESIATLELLQTKVDASMTRALRATG